MARTSGRKYSRDARGRFASTGGSTRRISGAKQPSGTVSQKKLRAGAMKRGEKFIARAKVGMKRLEANYKVASMRLNSREMEKAKKGMKGLRRKAQSVGARLERLNPKVKGLGRYYVP